RIANVVTIVPKVAWRFGVNSLRGRHPYFIVPGGTSPMACLGHVNAAFELRRQIENGELPEPEFLFVPLGSLGTAAGRLLGCRLAGLRTRIVGVVTSYRWYATAKRVTGLANKTHALMKRSAASVPDARIAETDIDVVRGALGSAYAEFTPESVAMARQLMDCEPVPLAGTYSA